MALFLPDLDKEMLQEDFSDTISSFVSYVEKKLNGYSVGEVDSLINKARRLSSETDKRELLQKIRDSVKTAKDKLADVKDKESDRYHELHLQVEVLNSLASKVSSFNPINGKYDSDDNEEKNDRKLNLDEH